MTSRERVLAVLNGQQPDRVPWLGDLDYWATAMVGRGQKPQGFQKSPAYIDWHLELGVGFYLQGYQHLHANTQYEPDYDFARQRVELLRQTGAGVMLAYLPKSPLMQMVALDVGIPTPFCGAGSPAAISRH